jgi:hypothetical protein
VATILVSLFESFFKKLNCFFDFIRFVFQAVYTADMLSKEV